MKKYLDPITQTAFIAFITAILFCLACFYQKNDNKKAAKNLWIAFAVGALITSIRGITSLKSPALILDNQYKGDGCYKCESETDCIIRPLAELKNDTAIDGLNTGFKPGEVYKMSNGVHAYISADGNVRPYSPISRAFAGWKSKDFFAKQGAAAQWQPLFECQVT